MAKFNEKISTILNSQIPEFVIADHPKFAEFLKVYYQLLESAELQVKDVQNTVGVLIETETGQNNNIVLNSTRIGSAITPIDEGDKILLEETGYGKFIVGETIKGETSGAEAKVLSEDLANSRLIISANDKFITNEIVNGLESLASATISNYRPQPVQNISDLVNFRDPDKAIESFLNNFRNEFLATLPEVLDNEVDKRNLIKNVKSLYKAKGTAKANKLFFQMLFNETPDIYYPNRDLLKPSIGKFSRKSILRVTQNSGNILNLTGKTISMVSGTNTASALVENVTSFAIGTTVLFELELNTETITGTFLDGATITGVDNTDETLVAKGTIKTILNDITITNDGHLYTTDSSVTISGGGGSGATALIEEVGSSGIEDIIVVN